MAVSLIGRIIDLFFHDGADGNRLLHGGGKKRIPHRRSAALHPDGLLQQESKYREHYRHCHNDFGRCENSAARVPVVSVLGGFQLSCPRHRPVGVGLADRSCGRCRCPDLPCGGGTGASTNLPPSAGTPDTQESLVRSVLEYIQGMGIVKAFGLERDSTQSIGSAIKAGCRDNLQTDRAGVAS